MFPMMDPDKMKPMEEDEAVKKMATIGAIMQGAGMDFGEEDMRLLSSAFAGVSSSEEQIEAIIARYSGEDMDDVPEIDDEAQADQVEEDDDDEISLNELDFGC